MDWMKCALVTTMGCGCSLAAALVLVVISGVFNIKARQIFVETCNATATAEALRRYDGYSNGSMVCYAVAVVLLVAFIQATVCGGALMYRSILKKAMGLRNGFRVVRLRDEEEEEMHSPDT